MIFGTTFSGACKKQNEQFITSKIVWVVLPLGITSTFLVTKREGKSIQGLEITTQYKHLLYMWGLLLGLSSLIGGVSMTIISFDYEFNVFLFFVGIFFTLLGAFSFYWYGVLPRKTTPQEKFIREQFFKTTGYYVMPEWVYADTFNSFYQAMREHYITYTNSEDWQEMLKRLNPDEDGFAITFCLTYMDNIARNKKMANKVLLENYQEYCGK